MSRYRQGAKGITSGQATAQRDDPTISLAMAVVQGAAYDYRMARLALKSTRKKEDRLIIDGKIKELEKFFMGDWCALLSNNLGEAILDRLKSEKITRKDTILLGRR